MPYRSCSRSRSRLLSLLLLLSLPLMACNGGDGFVDPDGTTGPEASVDAVADPDLGIPKPDVISPFDALIGPPVKLSVGTFNVQNFFDEHDDPAHEDELPTTSAVADKVKKLGSAIRKLKVDVLALQEVENEQLLKKLNSQELGSLGYKHVTLFEGNDIRGIDVALLSRFPIYPAISHMNDRFQGVDGDTKTYGFSRDCLEATIEPSPGRKLILLVNHLRASDWKNPQEAIDRRLAQAKRVREIADATLKVHPNANLAVIGDLNDVPGSKTLSLVLSGPPLLFDLVSMLPASERYTTHHDGNKIQLDYILAAPGLKADLVQGSVLVDHSQVFSDASDHFPVKATFDLH